MCIVLTDRMRRKSAVCMGGEGIPGRKLLHIWCRWVCAACIMNSICSVLGTKQAFVCLISSRPAFLGFTVFILEEEPLQEKFGEHKNVHTRLYDAQSLRCRPMAALSDYMTADHSVTHID